MRKLCAGSIASAAPACAVLCAVLSSGCAQNALFELYVEVPPPLSIDGSPSPATHVRLAIVAAEAAPGDSLSGSFSRIVALPEGLRSSDEAWLGVTLVRGVAPETNPTTIRVLYCTSATLCDEDSALGYHDVIVERAFYTARRTCHAHFLDDEDYTDGLTLPSEQARVTRCQVGGCVDALFMESPSFCNTSGEHFCVRSAAGDYCDQVRDRIGDGLIEL